MEVLIRLQSFHDNQTTSHCILESSAVLHTLRLGGTFGTLDVHAFKIVSVVCAVGHSVDNTSDHCNARVGFQLPWQSTGYDSVRLVVLLSCENDQRLNGVTVNFSGCISCGMWSLTMDEA